MNRENLTRDAGQDGDCFGRCRASLTPLTLSCWMSRVSPYPTTPRSARPIADYGDTQSTRPLEIGRSVRPSTPTNPPFSNGPSRPQKSGLRRQTSISSIDSNATRDSRGDSALDTRRTPPRSRSRPTAMPISTSPVEMSPTSTASPGASATVNAALSALQNAGQRRRAMTAGSEDAEWERRRTLEQEAERQLQKRIKDRVPQRRAKGKAKAGDIDGMCFVVATAYNVVFTVVWDTAVLDQIQDEWEPCTSPDVRPIVPCEGLSYNTKVARSLALWISRSNFSMNRPREKTCALFNLPSVYYSTPSRDPLIVRSPLGPSLTVSDPPHRKPPGVCRSTTPPRINAGTTQQYPTIYEGSPSLFDGSQGVLRQQTRGSSADVVTTANFGGDDTDIGPNV